MPEFEFDALKSAQNERKHGIALADAVPWWNHPDRRLFPTKPVKGESRHARCTHHQGSLWTVIFTLRLGKVRLISARPASREERARYHDR